jgi:hypothetical protein
MLGKVYGINSKYRLLAYDFRFSACFFIPLNIQDSINVQTLHH